MFSVHSERARGILERPRFFTASPLPGMQRFHSDKLDLQALLELDQGIVKNLSFSGGVPNFVKIYLESMASLLIKRPLSSLRELSLRECEAYLRDRNSVPALDPLAPEEEELVLKIFHWIKGIDPKSEVQDYAFASENRRFERLGLVDKVKELKAFLRSSQVEAIYQGLPKPEVLDVEDLTVFVWAPLESDKEKEAFDRLHTLGVETFGEERLNFIPET